MSFTQAIGTEWRQWLSENFKKRLGSFVEKARVGKLIKGYGGTDKYY